MQQQAYDTPGEVTLRLEVAGGEILLDAVEGTRTEVVVEPARDDEASRTAVEETRIECRERRGGYEVSVEVPHRRGGFVFGRDPSVRIRVTAPRGCAVGFGTASADVRISGEVGRVLGRTASGDVTIDVAGEVDLRTASGDVRVAEARGSSSFRGVSGDVRVGPVAGDLVAEVVSGTIEVASCTGDVRIGSVSGDTDLGCVSGGSVSVKTVSGDLHVGVAPGTRVHVDVVSASGDLRSDLDLTDVPGEGSGPLLDIRGRTVSGGVRITRATAA